MADVPEELTPEWEAKAVAVLFAADDGIKVYVGQASRDDVWYIQEGSDVTQVIPVTFDDEGYADNAVMFHALSPDQQADLRQLWAQRGFLKFKIWPEGQPDDEPMMPWTPDLGARRLEGSG